MVIPYQMVSPKNMHTRNIRQTEQLVAMCSGMRTHTHIHIPINEKRGNEFERKQSKEEYMGGFKGMKRKGEIIKL